jgi:hypothetical protein
LRARGRRAEVSAGELTATLVEVPRWFRVHGSHVGILPDISHPGNTFAIPGSHTAVRNNIEGVSTHAWLVDEQGRRVSTLDLIVRGAFSAVTGLSGEVSLQAAQQVEADLGVPLRATLIGGEGARDAFGPCARLCDVNEDSVKLVRPDGYVSWRSTSSAADLTGTAEALRSALAAIPGR